MQPLVSPGLDAGETQGSSKSRRQTEQRDGHRRGSRSSRIASQALSPGEAPVGTLGAGEERRRFWGRTLWWWTNLQIDPLTAQEPHPLPSDLAATPIPPEPRGGSHGQSGRPSLACWFGRWTENGTDPARLLR
jgi:hypothetical protein